MAPVHSGEVRKDADAPSRSAAAAIVHGRGGALAVLILSLTFTALAWGIARNTIWPRALPDLEGAFGATDALFLGGGMIISLLLFAVVWTLASTRQRAKALALEMTSELRESEARFRALTKLSSDWYWEQDEHYRFTSQSGGGKGWSRDAINRTLGLTRWELPVVGMSEQDWAVHRALLDARQPFENFMYRRCDTGGVLRTISITGEPVFDAQGIFKGYHGIGSDITDRVERENALAESEARFRNAFDSASIGMAIVSLEGRWQQVNPPLCQMLGYSGPELLMRTFQDITHPDDLEADLGYLEQLLRGEIPSYQMEKRYFHQDGHVVWVLLSVSMARASDDTPLHFVGQIQDITARKQTEGELAASRHFLAGLIDAIPVPLTVKDDNRCMVIVNEATAKFHDRPAADFLGKLDSDIYPPEWVEQLWAEDDAVADSGTPLEVEQAYRTASGASRWVIKYKRRIVSPDGRRWLITTLIDITDRRQTEIALRQSEARFRALTELSSDFYWEHDENFRITEISGRVLALVGISAQAHLGKTRWEIPGIKLSEKEWDAHRAILHAHLPFTDFAYERIGPDGEPRWLSMNGQPVFDDAGKFTGYRGVGKDVTAAKLAEARIQYLAYHDGLTTLPNRSSFSLILGQGIARARRESRQLAVLFIDLDRFKNINDTLGHDAGDAMLREVGKRLRHCVRQSDTVARLGGDEFVILLDEISAPGHVAKVARKILADIGSPLDINGQEFRVSASIGVSIFPLDGSDEQTLMKNADIAMYHAKQEGRNNCQFHSETMDTHSLERLALESSLRRALERNEFELHYQAKISLDTSRMTGMEALLRWRHPDLGMLPPAQFIPIAEETGLIVPIGYWVIRTACLQNRAWQDRGLPPMRVAVNLSARQFTDESLTRSIAAILKETGMDPVWLELEITESLIMHNVGRTMQVLTTLGNLGIRIAIDDFGTGHSSLAYLKRFPIDTLKIDRSFISDLPGDAEDKAITTAIIAMGKSLDLTVVAEGVETQDQLDCLRALGCDEFQGYYSNRPLPAAQFVALLQAERIPSTAGIAVT